MKLKFKGTNFIYTVLQNAAYKMKGKLRKPQKIAFILF